MKPHRKQPALINSLARVVERGLFSVNRVSIFARYWWSITRQNTANLMAGRKAKLVVVKEYATENYALKKIPMNNKLSPAERRHLASVKELPCGVCGASGPSDAHHIEQGLQYTCIPLCKDCHQGSFNGIHGQRRIWNVLKKTEMTVLNDTIKQLMGNK